MNWFRTKLLLFKFVIMINITLLLLLFISQRRYYYLTCNKWKWNLDWSLNYKPDVCNLLLDEYFRVSFFTLASVSTPKVVFILNSVWITWFLTEEMIRVCDFCCLQVFTCYNSWCTWTKSSSTVWNSCGIFDSHLLIPVT